MVYWRRVLSQGRVSLEQRLRTAILLILSLSFSADSQIKLAWHTDIYYTTHIHSSQLLRASPPQGWEVYSTIWLSIVLPQYQNRKMLSSINWLRKLIARDKAKQPQLKNQLTKSHESSQPTIASDISGLGWSAVETVGFNRGWDAVEILPINRRGL